MGTGLLLFLLLPLVALALASSPAELSRALSDPRVGSALGLTLRTTIVSLTLIVVGGTPLAWFLGRRRRSWLRVLESALELPVVIPPAVMGIALLLAFGRNGLLGQPLTGLGLSIPFTPVAVVMAQTVVAAPFYVLSATAAFREIDDDLLLVGQTLGASPTRAFLRIALPIAAPGLIDGMALCWARAVGEFGATLLFAGNLSGRTQTMPLAIYAALESDVSVATAIAIVLGIIAFATLLAARALQSWMARRRRPRIGEGNR